MFIDILKIAAGIVLLYVGGELLVRSSIAISIRFGISRLIIGLTVVALGTSLPELFVSVAAVIGGVPEIATANIVGSNIINIALILPLIPLCVSLTMPHRLRRVDYPIMLISFLLMSLLIVDWRSIGTAFQLSISPVDGCILLLVLMGYLWYLIRGARRDHAEKRGAERAGTEEKAVLGVGKMVGSVACVIGGGVALSFGSDLLVGGAKALAISLGVSTRIIALTVVAHGTNLPELFAAFIALRKKEGALAFGNLIGSNIINTLFILGFIGVVAPLHIANARMLFMDIGALLAISIYIYGVLLSVKQGKQLHRWHGVLMITAYIAYFTMVAIW